MIAAIAITPEERLVFMRAAHSHMNELRSWIESSQRYVDSFAERADELPSYLLAKYRDSSTGHLASLREDLAAMESLWLKLIG